MVNPRRNLTVSNAVAYDILLLLTYKVTLSVPQLTSAVSEYLYRMYTEQLNLMSTGLHLMLTQEVDLPNIKLRQSMLTCSIWV